MTYLRLPTRSRFAQVTAFRRRVRHHPARPIRIRAPLLAQHHKDLNSLPFSDLAAQARVIRSRHLAERGLGTCDLIVDPQCIIRFVYVTDLSVSAIRRMLRVLDACRPTSFPFNWNQGDPRSRRHKPQLTRMPRRASSPR